MSLSTTTTRVLFVTSDEQTSCLVATLLAPTKYERFEIERMTHPDTLPLILGQRQHDVCLIEEHDPRQCLELLQRAAADGNTVPLILLSDRPDAAEQTLPAGAADVLLRSDLTTAVLVRAIRYAIERQRTTTILHQQDAYLASLHQTSLALLDHRSVDDLLHTIATQAATLLGTPHGYVALGKPGATTVTMQIGVGAYRTLIGNSYNCTEGMVGRVFNTGEPVLVDNYSSWEHRIESPLTPLIHAAMAAPLTSNRQTIGTLGIAYLEADRDRRAAGATNAFPIRSISVVGARQRTPA